MISILYAIRRHEVRLYHLYSLLVIFKRLDNRTFARRYLLMHLKRLLGVLFNDRTSIGNYELLCLCPLRYRYFYLNKVTVSVQQLKIFQTKDYPFTIVRFLRERVFK